MPYNIKPVTQSTLFIGLMSGTSLDAIDAVLVDFSIPPQYFKIVATHTHPLPDTFQKQCLRLIEDPRCTLDEIATLDVKAGQLFAQTTLELLEKAQLSPQAICAIGSHGQTIRHCPENNPAFTWQIGDPNVIAALTQITTVTDFRRRDIAMGGQGAPLAPAFHHTVYRSPDEDRVIVNIGGMSNLTILAKDNLIPLSGFDSGPGNCLMDYWIQKTQRAPFDENGQFAKTGKVHEALLQLLLEEAYFKKPPPKSTGRELFNPQWLYKKLTQINSHTLSNQDIQRTLLEMTAVCIAEAIDRYAPQKANIFVCGGGAYNQFLLERLSAKLERPIATTAVLGISPTWTEAALCAWLARETLAKKAINLTSITGSRHPVILGGVYYA